MPLLTVMHVYFGSQARRLPISTAHSLMHHRCRLKYHTQRNALGLGLIAAALVAAAVQKKMLALAASAMPLLSLRPPL